MSDETQESAFSIAMKAALAHRAQLALEDLFYYFAVRLCEIYDAHPMRRGMIDLDDSK